MKDASVPYSYEGQCSWRTAGMTGYMSTSEMRPGVSMFRHIMDVDMRCRLSPGSSSVSAVICLTMLKNAAGYQC